MKQHAKFNVWTKYGVDLNKCKNGAKLILDNDGEVFIIVGRISTRNLDYHRELVELQTKYRGEETEQSNGEYLRLLCKHFVKGWQGITDKEGNELEFTLDNCVMLLTEIPDLEEMVLNFGTKRENYALDLLSKTIKN